MAKVMTGLVEKHVKALIDKPKWNDRAAEVQSEKDQLATVSSQWDEIVENLN